MKKIFYSIAILVGVFSASATYAQDGYYHRNSTLFNRPVCPEAKSAVIGAGGGAILGAIISRDHGQGALLGAILGGASGYLYEKEKEKSYDYPYRDGRNYGYDDRRDEEYRNREYRGERNYPSDYRTNYSDHYDSRYENNSYHTSRW
jgi:YMGG-like Gly-zipper